MNRITALLCALVVGCASRGLPVDEVAKLKPIKNPMDWAETYFRKTLGGQRKHLTEMRADIDHDGVNELFIGSRAGQGNAGMPYAVFKTERQGYRFLGVIFFHQRAFRILPLAPDGSIRLRRYWRSSSREGTLATISHDGGKFIIVESEVIHPGDGGTEEGRRKYSEAFW